MNIRNMEQRFIDLLPDANICLLGLQGSRMLGMQVSEDADYDYRGVYVAPNEQVLSISNKPKEQYIYTDSRDHQMDFVIYEVEKFMRLCLKGNPSVIHIFFVPKHNIKTDIGDYLLKNKHVFLGEKHIRNAFGGYAMQQVLYLKRNGGFPDSKKREKHLRHCFRLFDCGKELLETGDMTFPLPPERVKEYFEIASIHDDDEVMRIFKERDEQFRKAKSILPSEPNYYMADKILLKIRGSMV